MSYRSRLTVGARREGGLRDVAETDRRRFLQAAVGSVITGASLMGRTSAAAAQASATPTAVSVSSPTRAPGVQAEPGNGRAAAAGLCIDTHMHVWTGDPQRFPFAHPFDPAYRPPATAATVELLIAEMDACGISHCVLVQTICHGWDNRYLAECIRAHPDRFRGHGLIDPTDPGVADRLEFWIREHKLSGMRFSPLYYLNRDDWLDAAGSRRLWQKATELKAVFNFFITTSQLPRLETMIAGFPEVRVVIDHLARVDLRVSDPLPEFRKLLALARYPSVSVKVSELSVLSPSGVYPYSDTFPWVRRLYDAFGPDRLLWGTGFPGATRAEAGRPTLTQELDLIRREIPFLNDDDRGRILGRNAAGLWGFT